MFANNSWLWPADQCVTRILQVPATTGGSLGIKEALVEQSILYS